MSEQTEITINVELIPAELKTLSQWVAWRYEQSDPKQKAKKIPYDARTGKRASVSNPKTWTDCEAACQAFERGSYGGIGFVFTENDDFCGIDLDNCRNAVTGEVEKWAQDTVDRLKSYTELSPSGSGLHIIVKAKLPAGGRKMEQVEIYDRARYFTVTGDHLDGTPLEINSCQADISILYEFLFGSEDTTNHESVRSSESILSDQEVLCRAHRAKTDGKFKRLYSGNGSDYSSPSQADLALCSHLAFFTSGNVEQIDRLFRHSKLFREKWNEKHFSDGRTYGEATIQKAIEGTDWTIQHQASSVSGNKPWPQLDPAALHGPAGEIVRVLGPHTEADPVAMLGHFLSEVSALVGRGQRIKVGSGSMPLNFNAVFVGQTSKARKGTAEKEVRYVIQKAIPEWKRGECHGNLSSGEGLVWAVRDEDGDDRGVEDKRLYLVQPEFGSVLKIMNREGNSLSGIIRDAWDGEDLAPMTKNSRIKATKPHIVIVGHVTEEELKKYLTSTEAGNGFGNRFAWFVVRRTQILPFPNNPNEAELIPIYKRLKEAIDLAKVSRYLPMTNKAKEAWAAIYPDLSEGRSGTVGALLGRSEAQVLRLAGLYALLDKCPYIMRVHLEAAVALWQYAEDSVEYIFGDVTGDEIADKLLHEIRRCGQLTDSEVSASLKRNVSALQLENAKRLLQERGLIESEMIKSGGRPARVWKEKLR